MLTVLEFFKRERERGKKTSRSTIYRWIAEGKLKTMDCCGKLMILDEGEIGKRDEGLERNKPGRG